MGFDELVQHDASELTKGVLSAGRLPSEAARTDQNETIEGTWEFNGEISVYAKFAGSNTSRRMIINRSEIRGDEFASTAIYARGNNNNEGLILGNSKPNGPDKPMIKAHLNGNVGVGDPPPTSPINALDVSGGMAVGSGFAGSNTAPTNGLLVEGKIEMSSNGAGIFVNNNGDVVAVDDSGNTSVLT